MNYAMCGFSIADVCEKPIIGSNEELLVGAHDNGPSFRSNSWINNSDVNRPRRKRLVSREQRERTGLDILWRYLVSEINDHRPRIDRENRTLHCTDEVISRPEIGEQSNNRVHRTPVSVEVRIFRCCPCSRRISLPRCVITPAVPAPPPMIAPIAAPLPPPAITPMIAPMPDAAPTLAASSFVESWPFTPPSESICGSLPPSGLISTSSACSVAVRLSGDRICSNAS